MTTKRRSFVAIGTVAACICVTLAVVMNLPPRRGVTHSNFDLIHVGMSLQEVEQILEGKGIHSGSSKSISWFSWLNEDRSEVIITTFRDDKLAEKEFIAESFEHMIRRWLRLRTE